MTTILAYLEVLEATLPFLLQGLLKTIVYSIAAIALGSILGCGLGLVRSLHLRGVDRMIGLYLHLFRGSPFLVQLYVVYFVLPNFGIALESTSAGILALTLYTSSYVTEIAASAIDSVPRGQREAARSCGMTGFQTYVHVLVPQAVKLMLPPLASVYVIVVKSTSLFSVIGLGELMRVGTTTIQLHPAHIVFIYCTVALLYFAYCYPILIAARWLEDRLGSLKIEA